MDIMKNKKYMRNDGWDMNEKGMLKKLSKYAQEGWLLDHMGHFHFTLIKGEAKSIKYAMDYRPKEKDKETYIDIFQGSGWNYVCDDGAFYIFSAPLDAIDIHTDKKPVKQQFQQRMLIVFLVLVLALIITVTGLKMEKSLLSFLMAIIGGMMSGGSFVWLIGLFRQLIKKEIA